MTTRRRLLSGAAGWASALALPARGQAAADPVAALTLRPAPGATGRLSYDGSAGGPVVRLRPGTPLSVRLTNASGVPTSLQWHGLRGPAAIDPPLEAAGAVPPQGALAQRFVPPDSGLFWFHPAAIPGLADGTAAGLRGALIVEEADPPAAELDLLLILSDGEAPGTLVVNGAAAPWSGTIVPGGRLRLRLLNASTARILFLSIEGARPKVIAIDGQPCDLFAPVRDTVPAGPGARFELMLDAPAEARAAVRLLARGMATGEGPRPPDTPLMVLSTEGPLRAPLPPIAPLPRNPVLPAVIPLERSARATLTIEQLPPVPSAGPRWRLNGTASLALPGAPLLTARRGEPVTLAFDCRAHEPVPLRLHGHAMRLLHAKDDGWEPYWRDSVILAPASVTHVAFLADNPGRWLIESAAWAQAAGGLRHWFEVR